MTLGIFQGHGTVSHRISQNGVWYGKSYYRQLIGNRTLAFDWCHFWWPWSTFEGHFSLGCHFHVHFSYPWHAFASHGLPAIAELLVILSSHLFGDAFCHFLINGCCCRNKMVKCKVLTSNLSWSWLGHAHVVDSHGPCMSLPPSLEFTQNVFRRFNSIFYIPLHVFLSAVNRRHPEKIG